MTSAALPEGYSSAKRLQGGPQSDVYGAERTHDGCAVILKLYTEEQTARSAAQREFEALRVVAGKGTPEPLELILEHVVPVLVMRRAPGISLADWSAVSPPEPSGFLSVALRIAQILTRVHAARFIHRDVNPWNVLVDPASLEPSLIDFGLARRLGEVQRGAIGSGGPAGTLLYIAPEQTGRMNRGCDFRSDLYSLGATLYHVLTGRPPFDSNDPLELIHAHMARKPVAPLELRPALPPVVSELVLKLMRKDPEERYQSARVLAADLLRLQDQLARSGRIDPGFELAASDAPERPRFSRRLYGREREVAQLTGLYARAQEGTAPPLIVSGAAGVGKSVLVDALRSALAESGGYLAMGGFDLYRDRAYAGWEAALGSLVQQLLVESDARLEYWRDLLRGRLGNTAGAICDLLPDLKFILGDVPPVQPVGPRETQARLSLALQRLLAACGGKQHPLVVWLDDLQWSDAGSRFLLEDLLGSGVPEGVLWIGSYRSDDVGAGHPLAGLLLRLGERHIALESVELAPLSREAALAMLAEALERPLDQVRGIGQRIERCTGNNPMLLRQFVEHIHARGLLRYEPGAGWQWDAGEIAAADIPDGAVALMTAKIGRLDSKTRALLEFVSCVGEEFDLELLCELSGRERGALEQSLYALAGAGLIAPCQRGFRFVHGRLREAVHSLVPDAARDQLHCDIARLLLSRLPAAEWEAHAFAIVEHLNRGLAHMPEKLRGTAIRLNLAAGKRALATGAASTAEGHLRIARGLFRAEEWESERAQGVELFLQSAEGALLRSDLEGVRTLLESLEPHCASLLESAQVAVKRIQLLALTSHPDECMAYALRVLRGFGVRLPLRPSAARAGLALRLVHLRLRFREGKPLFHRATSAEPHRLGPILVIGACIGVLGRGYLYLAVLASCWVISSNLRHGYFGRPGYTLGVYAGWLQMLLGDSARAQRLVPLALEWNEKVPDPHYGPRMEMYVQAILRPWWMRRRQALGPLARIAETMRESGDLEYVVYTRFLSAVYGALAGTAVRDAEQALLELADSVRRSGSRYPEPERCHRTYRLLLAPDPSLEAEVAESDTWLASNQDSAEPYIRTLWLLVLCVYSRYDLAFLQSQKLGKRLFHVVPYVHVADHTFYRGLAAAELASSLFGARRRRYLRELGASHRRLRRWALHGPDFQHMEQLLAAEQARLRGRATHARPLYERAAQLAKQQDFIHHAALACERHGRMLGALRRETEAASALREASALYAKWGSEGKASALEEDRRQLAGN